MDSLPALLSKSAQAREFRDWSELESISMKALRLVSTKSESDESTLRILVRDYLSSIVGTGEFLTNLESKDSARYRDGLARLQEFLDNRPHYFKAIENTFRAGQEIALLVLDPTPTNRNKIAKHLREIARPDISIVICKQILQLSRLNYYSLTVLCGAYCDLGQVDKAIEAAEVALKVNPDSGKSFPLNALVRAHTMKFKSTGDFSEIDTALRYGHMSIELKLDSYIANAFIAAAIASGYEDEIIIAKEVLTKAEPQLKTADIAALFQTYQAAQALAPKSQVVEPIDESTDEGYFGDFDTLFDLVKRDEGFLPEVHDKRKMIKRFGEHGWFLQGLSKVPCPSCERVALHSYRKHFKRYGKVMHYWALVCDECKTATDSIDYDKIAFSFISGDLEESFPVAELCKVCQNL